MGISLAGVANAELSKEEKIDLLKSTFECPFETCYDSKAISNSLKMLEELASLGVTETGERKKKSIEKSIAEHKYLLSIID